MEQSYEATADRELAQQPQRTFPQRSILYSQFIFINLAVLKLALSQLCSLPARWPRW